MQLGRRTTIPAHASWPRFEIGAEYLVHSIPTEKGALYARDYLVVEIAIFPGKQVVAITSNSFTAKPQREEGVAGGGASYCKESEFCLHLFVNGVGARRRGKRDRDPFQYVPRHINVVRSPTHAFNVCFLLPAEVRG
jgi:hypothetical protein